MKLITIDGPTSSGKSTIAALIADRFNICHINSGFLYRSLAYLLVTYGGYTPEALYEIMQDDIETCFDSSRFIYTCGKHAQVNITFDGVDITPFLKTRDVDMYASCVAQQEQVRAHINKMQHIIADSRDCVIDGRDTGSVVFPHATIKFFLTAPLDVRAGRWFASIKKQNMPYTFEDVRNRIRDRDMRDESRTHGKLIIAQDAIMIDNADLTIEQTFELFLSHIRAKKIFDVTI